MRISLASLYSVLVLLPACIAASPPQVAVASPATSTTTMTPPKNSPLQRDQAVVPPIGTTVSSTENTPTTYAFMKRPSADSGMRYSSNDWFITLLATPTSYILRRIGSHFLFNLMISIAVAYASIRYPDINLSIPMVGHNLLGSSLGLLLSYRTNSAYSRFWEARGYWTQCKSTCRNLATMMQSYISHHSPKSAEKFLVYLAAYPLALMHLCLGGHAMLSEQVQKLIPQPAYPEQFYDSPSLPAILLGRELHNLLRQAADESPTSQRHLVEAKHLCECSHMVDSLISSMSSCEKILRTPVPWTYSRHTSRFLTLWMGTLPFALVGTVKPFMIVAVVAATSFCMFGIEELGHLIEQPFLGDPLGSDDMFVAGRMENGKLTDLMERGQKTRPYDIGIPVCSLAVQIRKEVQLIASIGGKKH
ncbi:putative membrane protein [Fistulifera solaris]|uniref:Putative membrane protein n=1 Tax=Fistulifera solaris TaxID=1519565 RepID=A0A1Z5JJG8_FISSO|nr:putative membrane protein [Fistulifera solaris]|eukprot:GAX14155.1 putative membrane protein [Fistulifera solaris]